MSVTDGLAVSQNAVTKAFLNRCREMVVLANELQAAVMIDPLKPVSTIRLEMKARAVADAAEMVNAVSHAVRIDNRRTKAV